MEAALRQRKSKLKKAANENSFKKFPFHQTNWTGRIWSGVLGSKKGYPRVMRFEKNEQTVAM
jgi:hypothetical protein